MRRTSTFVFLISFLITVGQTNRDSILKINADRYLNKKFGEKFTTKYLTFQFIKSAGIACAFYQVKAKPRTDGKNTLLVYFDYMSDQVDTTRHLFSKQEIVSSTKRRKPSKLFIGLEQAKQIAKTGGLPEKEQPWEISAHDFGKDQTPVWSFKSTKFSSEDGHGAGNWVIVNMTNGSTEFGMWSSTP